MDCIGCAGYGYVLMFECKIFNNVEINFNALYTHKKTTMPESSH